VAGKGESKKRGTSTKAEQKQATIQKLINKIRKLLTKQIEVKPLKALKKGYLLYNSLDIYKAD